MAFEAHMEWEAPSTYLSSIWVSFDLEIDAEYNMAPNGDSKNEVGAAIAQAIADALQNIATEGEVTPTVLSASRSYTATENIPLS